MCSVNIVPYNMLKEVKFYHGELTDLQKKVQLNCSVVSGVLFFQGEEHCRVAEVSLLVNCKDHIELVWQRSFLIYDV